MAVADEVRTRQSQYLHALACANKIRLARAAQKNAANEIKTGPAQAAFFESLRSQACCDTMEIMEILMCFPRWGKGRALRCCRAIPVPENKAVGTLTMRQHNAVCDYLEFGPKSRY
jgi:hypothetical protein